MEIDRKRVWISVLIGAILGIFCIIGVGYRLGFSENGWFLFGMWYNRIIMGLVIGLAGGWSLFNDEKKYLKNAAVRGLIMGVLVTSAFLFSTSFKDPLSWGAGIVYGVIIDLGATYFTKVR